MLTKYVSTQELVRNVSVKLNKYGWLPFDYFQGRLLYFSETQEYSCSAIERTCSSSTVSYRPNKYLMTKHAYVINDDITNTTCRSDNYNGLECLPYKVRQGFNSIWASDTYIYILKKNDNAIFAYSLSSLSPVGGLRTHHSNWYLDEEGFYGFYQLDDGIDIVKYSMDLYEILWTYRIPNCTPKDYTKQMFFTTSGSKIFIVCASENSILLFNKIDQSLIGIFSTDKENVIAIKSSNNFLFLLYEDSTVVQYTLKMEYVFTYSVTNMTVPEYNALKVDDNYLFYVLVASRINNIHVSDAILLQWSIRTQISSIQQTYTSINSNGTNSDFKESDTNLTKIVRISENLNNVLKTALSYIDPVTYVDSFDKQHITYFSGGAYLSKGTCGDIFLHDIVVTEIISKDKQSTFDRLYQVHQISEIPKHSLSEYASTMLDFDGNLLYLIHGGVSCDYQTVYSDLFAIDISAKRYIKFSQMNHIS
jgi:hypothetical protein